MVRGKTKNGFSFTISDEATNDWEILEALRTVDEGDPTAIVNVLKRLIGEKQYKALKENLRDEKGVVKVTDMVEALKEILTASSKTKN